MESPMCGAGYGENQYVRTVEAMGRLGLTTGELWLYYFSMGGNVAEYEVTAYLHGLYRFPALDRDLLSLSINEMHDDIFRGIRAPSSSDGLTSGPPDRSE